MVRLRIAPIALLVIVCATMIPVDFRPPAIDLVSFRLNPQDFVANVFLFLPLGFALCGRRTYVVIAVCGLLSLSAEAFQIVHTNRHVGVGDIAANVAGGLLGALCGRLRGGGWAAEAGSLCMNRGALSSIAFVIGSGLLLAIGMTGKPHDFSNWDPTYRLAISDEITRDRSWDGTLLAWVAYDRPLERERIRDLAARGFPGDDGFDSGELPLDPVGRWENTDPLAPGRYIEFGPEEPANLYDRLRRTGKMSLLAWVRVKDTTRTDVRRILTYSQDPFHRNFTLGQDAGALAFRLRTPATGSNGIRPETRTAEILEPGSRVFVAATYDGFVTRLFVDGDLMGRQDLAARGAAFPILHDTNLSLGLAICGGCFGGLLSVLFGHSRRRARFFLGLAGGLGVVAATWALEASGAWPVYPVRSLWQMAPPIGGGLVVAMSLGAAPGPSADRGTEGKPA